MAQVLSLLSRALSFLGEILGVVLGIRGLTERAAQEHLPYAVETIATNTQLALMNLTYGLAAAHAEREAILSAIADLQNASLTAIALTVQASEAPGWYAAPPVGSEIGDAVWLWQQEGEEVPINHLRWLERDAANRESYSGYPLRGNPLFVVSGPFKYPQD